LTLGHTLSGFHRVLIRRNIPRPSIRQRSTTTGTRNNPPGLSRPHPVVRYRPPIFHCRRWCSTKTSFRGSYPRSWTVFPFFSDPLVALRVLRMVPLPCVPPFTPGTRFGRTVSSRVYRSVISSWGPTRDVSRVGALSPVLGHPWVVPGSPGGFSRPVVFDHSGRPWHLSGDAAFTRCVGGSLVQFESAL